MKVLVRCPERHTTRFVDRDAGQLGVTITGSGAYQVRPWCDECGRWASGSIVTADVRAAGISILDLQVIADYRGMIGRCAVAGCEREAVEDHHFAPRALFGDEADYWPRALLCLDHHVEWHQRMTAVTVRVPAA